MITKTDARLVELFLEIIQIEGLSHKEKSVADFIITYLKNLGLKPTVDASYQKTESNTGNVICKIGTGGNFLLLSHMDTARTTKGVKPIVKEDRITSDGNTVLGVDNRVGTAVILRMVEKIITEKIKTQDFTIAFTTCEETTLEGSKNLDLPIPYESGFVFDSYLSPGHIVNESFGAATFKINIFGKASHAGISPDKGINAIAIAASAISKIKQGKIDDSTTINVGKIDGGTMVNVVPDQVYLEGEVRAKSSNKIDEELIKIKKVFESVATIYGGKIEFRVQWDFKPYLVSEESATYVKVADAIKKVGLNPKATITSGGSDASSLNELDISSVNLGIGAKNPHSNEEYILFEDLQKSFEIAMELVKK